MKTREVTEGGAIEEEEVRIDLHVHSSSSDKPYGWLMRAAKAAECYTTPRKVYDIATARGMNLVTICDHDAIAGALELCALAPNTFVSEEISARFPEDGCVVHTIALDITEAQHAEIQRLRRNIYELVTYLDGQGIAFYLCHALSAVNRRLQPAHVQRCLLMFRALELRNGTRDVAHEQALLAITRGLDAATRARWAEENPQVPALNMTGRYAFVGGSDDHAGLSIARAFTRFRGERSGRGVTAALRARATEPGGDTATAEVLSHNVYGVMAGHILSSGQLASGENGDGPGSSPALGRALERFAAAIAGSDFDLDLGELATRGHTDQAQAKMSSALETVLVRSGRDALGTLKEAVVAMRPADVAEAFPDVLRAIMLGIPYLAGASYHAHDRRAARDFASRLGVPGAARKHAGARPARVAVLTDTLDEVNGVALGLRRLARTARREGLDLRLVGIGPGDHLFTDGDGVVRLPSMLSFAFPEYPQLPFGLPHVPSLLAWLVREEIDLVQCSTPGPVGLAGLLAGRLAGVPVIGQYHTDVPAYATHLTGDPQMGDIAARFVGWFYGLLDQVLAPSAAVAERLDALGVPAHKVRRVPRGIDLDLFSPARRDAHAFAQYGLNGEPKVMYVGRLSREKGLDALVSGFRGLARDVASAKLLLVGGGPYEGELERESRRALPGRVIFTGEVTGDRLAALLASSDVFVYPSETETFGNAVVEAQASGVPVVVSDRGAARENVIDGVTGLVVDARDPEAIRRAMRALLEDPERRRRMGAEAARFAQRYDFGRAARGTFDLYGELLAARAEEARAA